MKINEKVCYNLTRGNPRKRGVSVTPRVALDMKRNNFGKGINAPTEPVVCDALLSPEEVEIVLERLENVGKKPALTFEELFDGLET